ncbi:4720_t:CDS:2 [Cetraspora pellucida]|uniref:4720_t:CDS:1 n=1 Tax=Cetraspora pellucida TaxID=1433469 RepID=A0A9N9H485_9GLOM|nr:4720_t:CDS:2 [Cetraspora pellucida]
MIEAVDCSDKNSCIYKSLVTLKNKIKISPKSIKTSSQGQLSS